MQAKQINRSALASAMGIKDAEGLAKLSQMSDDEIEGIYKEHKQLYHNIERAAEKERQSITNQPAKKGEVTKKGEPKYSKGNVLVRRDPNGNPYPKQSGEIELIELILGGWANLGNLMEHCCLDLGWGEAKFFHALRVISTPQHPKNNWRTMILPTINSDGEIILHLQQSISPELKKALQGVFKEIKHPLASYFPEKATKVKSHGEEWRRKINFKKGKISLEQKPPVTPPPQPDQTPECSAEDKSQIYAAIRQILEDNPNDLLYNKELLKNEVMKITRKSPENIDKAFAEIIRSQDSLGEGQDEGALPDYWVVEDPFGQLIIRFPVRPPKEEDQTDQDETQRI